MADAIQVPEGASNDPELKDVLDSLKADGHEIVDPSKPSEEAPKEPEAPEVKPPEEAPKPEEPKEETPAEPKPEAPKRESKFVPVGKYNEERHKRQELETRAERAEREAQELRERLEEETNRPSKEAEDELKTTAKQFAEKHGVDEAFVTELFETASKLTTRNTGLPKEVLDDIASIKEVRAQAEAAAQEAAQETGFNHEFDAVLKEFPDLADQKSALKELAFSEGRTNVPLRLIALEYRHDNGLDARGRKTAEAPVHTKDKAKVIDYANVTDDQIKTMSLEEFEEYSKYQDALAKRR